MSVRKVLLTKINLNDILESRHALYEKLKDLGENGALVPAWTGMRPGTSSRESDEIQRQSRILRKQLDEIDSVIDNHMLIQPARNADYCGIGVVVTCQRFVAGSGEPIGREETYEISGYRSTDLRSNPPVLSYDAPIAAAMRDLMVGEITANITLVGKAIYLLVKNLRLPDAKRREDEPQLRLVMPDAG